MEFVECPAWDALMTQHGCDALKNSALTTAMKIIQHRSVLAVQEDKFCKMIACSTCQRFHPTYDQSELDEVINEVHKKCLEVFDFQSTDGDTRSRYKRWYDKHGKEYKQKQREALTKKK